MIEIEHLVKDYGTVVAVRDLSFSVGRGEVVGFLGPNGAGKSTTLRIVAGFLGATSGTVRIDGHDIFEEPIVARRAIGYMPEAAPLYPEMLVHEYLRFRADIKGVRRRDRRAAVERAMRDAAVDHMAHTLIQNLSKGYRQRVGLADALVSDPPLLILDEPTAGLDPNQIREVRTLVRKIAENHTVLLSTHILSEVESTCDRAVVIDRGRLVAEGTIDELKARRQAASDTLLVHDTTGRASEIAQSVKGVTRVQATAAADATSPDLYRLDVHYDSGCGGERLERLVGSLVARGIGVREAAPNKASLEDVFVQLTLADTATERSEATG